MKLTKEELSLVKLLGTSWDHRIEENIRCHDFRICIHRGKSVGLRWDLVDEDVVKSLKRRGILYRSKIHSLPYAASNNFIQYRIRLSKLKGCPELKELRIQIALGIISFEEKTFEEFYETK